MMRVNGYFVSAVTSALLGLVMVLGAVMLSGCGADELSEEDRIHRENLHEAEAEIIVIRGHGLGLDEDQPHHKFSQNEMADMQSVETQKKAILDYGLESLLRKNEEEILAMYGELLEMGLMRGTEIVSLKMRGANGEQAGQLLYAIVQSYGELKRKSDRQRMLARLKYVKELLEKQIERERVTFNKVKKLAMQVGMPISPPNARDRYLAFDELLEKRLRELDIEMNEAYRRAEDLEKEKGKYAVEFKEAVFQIEKMKTKRDALLGKRAKYKVDQSRLGEVIAEWKEEKKKSEELRATYDVEFGLLMYGDSFVYKSRVLGRLEWFLPQFFKQKQV